MKKLIQEILPPIVYKAIQSLRNHLYSPKPKWNKISGGILEGCIIYVPTEQFYFKEMIEGAYDNFFCDFLKKVDLESQTIIDIGGHIGYHSMCFAKLTGKKGKVYVFEPNVFNVERMELIFGKNRDISDNISINLISLPCQILRELLLLIFLKILIIQQVLEDILKEVISLLVMMYMKRQVLHQWR